MSDDTRPPPITQRSAVISAWRDTLTKALADDEPVIVCCDPDFAEWPLDEPAIIESLVRWARPHHRLVMVARHYEELQRRHPRFVQWRRTWGHVVDPRAADDADATDLPSLLLAGRTSLELIDPIHWRAALSHAAADAVRVRDRLDVILQRSTPAFAATTLGL